MSVLQKQQLHQVTITLNGKPVTGNAEPRMLLSDFLREQLAMTSLHVGCEHGVCGACTVRIDGKAARSCLTLAVQADGRRIDTVESIAEKDGTLSKLQTAFHNNHALQCGYCTPGILMSVSHFLELNPKPSETEIRDMLSGHLCRCTGYTGMIRAILEVTGQAPQE